MAAICALMGDLILHPDLAFAVTRAWPHVRPAI